MAKTFDLDVDSPNKVVAVLLNAAQAYRESASELEASWQDPGAGKPWMKLAAILQRAADAAAKVK